MSAVHLFRQFPYERLSLIEKSSSVIPAKYNFLERIFRTNVFRFAVYQNGALEKFLVRFYKTCSQSKPCPEMFNPERAVKSLEIFRELGGKECFAIPRDKNAHIHMLVSTARDLETKIQSFGGLWEKRMIREGNGKKTILAIIPPDRHHSSWRTFENEYLLKMGWEKKVVAYLDGKVQEVIITCDDADLIDPAQYYKHSFLYTHSTSGPFIRDRKRAGLYLGMKQDICFYDNRGIWKSTGIPSERAFYLDIEAVYEKLQSIHHYDVKNLWLVGYCGGGPVAAYLKKKLHYEGVNFVEEQSFTDLQRDFISGLPFPARVFASFTRKGMYSRDLSANLPNMPLETGFNVEKQWSDLKKYTGPAGNVVLIHAANDPRLSKAAKECYEVLAKKVNRSVSRISFISPKGTDPHSDDFFKYPEAKRQFTNLVFAPT